MHDPVTIAVVQSPPVYMDISASIASAVAHVGRAADAGAKLVVFGETWLAGYPAWLDYCPGAALWDHEPTKEVFARLRRNSVVVPGPETEALAAAARDRGVVIVIGANERVDAGAGSRTLFNSLLTFGPDGALLNHHRKLVPTYTERLVWGPGDPRGLAAVATPVGRVGGLVCWEHWMPLARHALHVSGEEIHVAVWPTAHEMLQIASRHYAFEGRCFVVVAGMLMRARDLPAELDRGAAASDPDAWLLRGGSAVVGPNGAYVVEPVYDREALLVATLDLEAIDREAMTLDVTGHYNRPDVFDFAVKRDI